jgi:pilus assembly protein Flp/PilA
MKRSYFPVIQLRVIRFFRDEQGQDLVEYALIVAAIGLALVATVNQLSVAIVSLYSSITQGLASIGAGGA